jgi:cupin superfamily acireductone dioxygenase involved in methionine salvage
MGHGYQNVPYMAISPLNLKRESKLEGFYQEHD